MIKHRSLWKPTADAAEGSGRLTFAGLYHRLRCVRCRFLFPGVYRPLLDPAQGQRPLHWSRDLWGGGNCPPRVGVCTDPGSLCCRYSPWSRGGAFPWLCQPSWYLYSASWPGAARGVRYRPPGVDARLCGAQWSCSSKSGRSGGQRAPTIGSRLSGGQERL